MSFVRSYGQTKVAFGDAWGLYSAYGLPYLSESEAKAIAWEAAKNYQVKLVTEDDSIVFITPVWSGSPRDESSMVMVPGQLDNDSLSFGLSMGSTPRDGTTLFPFWKFLFYCQPIGGMQGVQVGVWGDTEEIGYCDAYGHYGGPEISLSPEPVASPLPAIQSITLVAALELAVLVITVAAALVLRKRKKSAIKLLDLHGLLILFLGRLSGLMFPIQDNSEHE